MTIQIANHFVCCKGKEMSDIFTMTDELQLEVHLNCVVLYNL